MDKFFSHSHKKFIILDSSWEGKEGKHVVLLKDIGFWAENIDELLAWCDTHGAEVYGMTVEFNQPEQLSLFLLRWI